MGSVTHIGQVRSRNEDAMGLRQASHDGEASLFVVADGMGGHSAGNVASQLAVEETIGRFFGAAEGDVSDRLRVAVEGANRQIWDSAQENPDYFRMGTTVVSAAILGNQADIANVGDSRLYLVRDGVIQQVTRDHSWVALQIELGELTPEEAAQSLNRSVLLRCLGEKSDVLVDMVRVRLRVGDILILCSDGLHGLVSADEIRQGVVDVAPQKASDDLVALANARGGTDNITVQVIRVDACPPPPEDEGDELVIHRVSHSDLIEQETPAPAPVAPVRPAAPMFAGVAPSAPSPPPRSGGEHAADAGVPWLLFFVAMLTGALLMAVADRVFFLPPEASVRSSPVPESSSPSLQDSLQAPSFPASPPPEVRGAINSPLPGSDAAPSEVPLPVSTGASAVPLDASGLPSFPRNGLGGSAVEEGREVLERNALIRSPIVFGNQVYWLEDSRLMHAPIRPTDGRGPAPVRLPRVLRFSQLTFGTPGFLVIALENEDKVKRLDLKSLTSRGLEGLATVGRTGGPVALLAAGGDLVSWVEEGSRDIVTVSMAHPQVERPPQTSEEEVVALAIPSKGERLYWTDGTRLWRDARALPIKVGRVTTLAVDETHLYWTEDKGDGQESALRRIGLNETRPAAEPQDVASLQGPVLALTAHQGNIYWVRSAGRTYALRCLER